MSDEARGAPDRSRIVNLIMENPKLIEEISALAKGDGEPVSDKPQVSESEARASSPTYAEEKRSDGRERRAQLLSALKPYLSQERCEAVDYLIRLARVGDAIRALK